MARMKVLVINVGSTSIKYDLYEMDTESPLAGGSVERVGSQQAMHRWEVGGERGEAPIAAPTVKAGLEAVLAQLTRAGGVLQNVDELRAVGHRVVHGGESLVRPVVITEAVKET